MLFAAEPAPGMQPAPATRAPTVVSTSPWSWKIGGANALNLGLLVATGAFLLKKKWVWAAVPAGVLAFHEGRKKGMF
jgi:hypothetical protein